MLTESFAYLEKYFRPAICNLPPRIAVDIFSRGRKIFLKSLTNSIPRTAYLPPEELSRTVWGLKFAMPIFNSAGMFKNAEGYEMCRRQGAGAFLTGTTTSNARPGNKKCGITHPAAVFPRSKTSVNWMGLPNDGHEAAAKVIRSIKKFPGCPVGSSLSSSPDLHGDEALQGLIDGMKLYASVGVDFIEINESCPNVSHDTGSCDPDGLDSEMKYRLTSVADAFLSNPGRSVPVTVKFSTDTDTDTAVMITKFLVEAGFDGVNFGNTSTDYQFARNFIDPREIPVLEYFTKNFGGGLSGAPLRSKSLAICKAVGRFLKDNPPAKEFALIRTGGIDSPEDIRESSNSGVALCQWFAGYFDNFGKYGHSIYKEIAHGLL